LVVARTGFANAVRMRFAEHAMVAGLGRGKLVELATMRLHLPGRTAFAVDILFGRIKAFDANIVKIKKISIEYHKTFGESGNFATIPWVRPLTATLIVAKIADPPIRRMLFLGVTSMVWRAKPGTWLGKVRGRKPVKRAAIAPSNKAARIIWSAAHSR
jgi:transposase